MSLSTVANGNVQAALDGGGLVFLQNDHMAGLLTISKPTRIIAEPGVTLTCAGIVCAPESGSYLDIGIENLTIINAGGGDDGLTLTNCRAALKHVTIRNFNARGLVVDGGIQSRFEQVSCSRNPVGLYAGGDYTSTTLIFSGCLFDQASDAAARVVGPINSLVFADYCIFQSSALGIVADGINTLTIHNPYFENVTGPLLTAGNVSEIASLVLVNPLAVGGAGNDPFADMFVFDRVTMLSWLGGGDCRVPRATWLRTTVNTKSGQVFEPAALGIPAIMATDKINLVQQNGRLNSPFIRMGPWNMQNAYVWTPDEWTISNGEQFPIYARSDGLVRIGSVNQTGLTGGIAVDNDGLMLESPNGTIFYLTVADNGTVTTQLKSS